MDGLNSYRCSYVSGMSKVFYFYFFMGDVAEFKC